MVGIFARVLTIFMAVCRNIGISRMFEVREIWHCWQVWAIFSLHLCRNGHCELEVKFYTLPLDVTTTKTETGWHFCDLRTFWLFFIVASIF